MVYRVQYTIYTNDRLTMVLKQYCIWVLNTYTRIASVISQLEILYCQQGRACQRSWRWLFHFFFSFFWFYDTLLGSNRSRGAAILPLVQELPFAAMVVGLLQHPWFFLTLLRSWLARLLRCGDYRGCWWGGNAPSTKVVWTNLTQLLLWNG